MKVYLDSSAILKRYVLEEGTDLIRETYLRALNGEAALTFSVWNIGEVLRALDAYHRRGWLEEKEYNVARESFITETMRLIKLGVVGVIPVSSRLLADSWLLVEKHHIYEADALQITSTKHNNAEQLLTGDRRLADISTKEEINAIYVS